MNIAYCNSGVKAFFQSPPENGVGRLFYVSKAMSAEELRQPLIRYLICLGLRPDEADDVAQESLFLLHRHAPRENPRGWLFRVAHNQARNRQNSYERRCADPLGAATAEDRAQDGDDPETAFLARERQQRLAAAVRALPEREREVLRLRARGMRYREIGEVLQLATSTVADIVDRTVRKLAGEMK